jgi:hypothetical protein
MILNAYAVLDLFLSLLRVGLGLLVVVLGVSAWRVRGRQTAGFESATFLEDRCYLLFLLAGILLVLNVLAWPIFYMLLQSYVPEWPGVMCIYGVTRIGTGSLGPSRFLPALVTILQLTKPALVFLSGAWFVLHLLNRRTRTGTLTGRVLLLLPLTGLLAAADAGVETAYLVIPKKEVFLSTGCCTEVFDAQDRGSRFLPATLLGEKDSPRLFTAYYALNAGMVLALGGCARLCRRRFPVGWLGPLLLGAVAALLVNVLFLIEIAAPRLLHLPNHHCPYDLVSRAPESLVAVALFLLGSFVVGWICVVGWLGNRPEADQFLPRTMGQLCRLGILAYSWSVLMMTVELTLT